MAKLRIGALRLRAWTDIHGQDLIEYALVAGVIAFAVSAIFPQISRNISAILFKASSPASNTGLSQGN